MVSTISAPTENSTISDKTVLSKHLQNLATRIEQIDASATKHLNTLATVIETDADAHAWTEVDLYHIIRPETIAERYRQQHEKKSRTLEYLEIGRNAFMFVPIGVTWYSISRATDQYQQLVNTLLAKNPNQTIPPFLYLWQQGFGGSTLTLSWVAMIDAILIVSILLATFIIPLFSNINVQKREEEAQQLYADLTHGLAEASLYLLQNRFTAGDNLEKVAHQIDDMAKGTLVSFQTLTTEISKQFTLVTGQVTQQFDQLSEQTTKQFNTISNQTTQRFQDATNQMSKELSHTLQQMSEQFTHTESDIANQFVTLSKGMMQQLQQGENYIQELGSFTTGLHQLSQDMQKAVSTIQVSSSSLDANVQRLNKNMQQLDTNINAMISENGKLTTQQASLSKNLATTVERVAAIATSLTTLKEQQDHWNVELDSTLNALTVQVEQTTLLTTSNERVSEQHRAFVQAIKNEREVQEKLIRQMIDMGSETKNIFSTIQTGASQVQRMVDGTQKVLQGQALLNSTVKADLAGITGNYHGAAKAIEDSAKALNDSVRAIKEANQEFFSILPSLRVLDGVEADQPAPSLLGWMKLNRKH